MNGDFSGPVKSLMFSIKNSNNDRAIFGQANTYFLLSNGLMDWTIKYEIAETALTRVA